MLNLKRNITTIITLTAFTAASMACCLPRSAKASSNIANKKHIPIRVKIDYSLLEYGAVPYPLIDPKTGEAVYKDGILVIDGLVRKLSDGNPYFFPFIEPVPINRMEEAAPIFVTESEKAVLIDLSNVSWASSEMKSQTQGSMEPLTLASLESTIEYRKRITKLVAKTKKEIANDKALREKTKAEKQKILREKVVAGLINHFKELTKQRDKLTTQQGAQEKAQRNFFNNLGGKPTSAPQP